MAVSEDSFLVPPESKKQVVEVVFSTYAKVSPAGKLRTSDFIALFYAVTPVSHWRNEVWIGREVTRFWKELCQSQLLQQQQQQHQHQHAVSFAPKVTGKGYLLGCELVSQLQEPFTQATRQLQALCEVHKIPFVTNPSHSERVRKVREALHLYHQKVLVNPQTKAKYGNRLFDLIVTYLGDADRLSVEEVLTSCNMICLFKFSDDFEFITGDKDAYPTFAVLQSDSQVMLHIPVAFLEYHVEQERETVYVTLKLKQPDYYEGTLLHFISPFHSTSGISTKPEATIRICIPPDYSDEPTLENVASNMLVITFSRREGPLRKRLCTSETLASAVHP